MACLLYSALRGLEVVNLRDGKVLGCVCDLSIDPDCGKITALLLPGEGVLGAFSAKKRITVPWDNIERIGEDTILVKYYCA